MNKEIADRWVAALRSGEFKQGVRQLESLDGAERFCCLGVLCKLAEADGVATNKCPGLPAERLIGGNLLFQKEVRDWSGLRTCDGALPRGVTLSYLNDEGHSFHQLAGLIEKHWADL